MKRRPRRTHHHNGLTEAADHGPGFSQRDARWVPVLALAAGQNMELAEIPDIDRPEQRRTKRVARRVDPLLVVLDLHKADGPDREMYLAAERFRRDAKNADGNSNSAIARLESRVSETPTGTEPTQRQLDAQERMRRAWVAIRGPENNELVADTVRLVVLGWATCRAVESARRCGHGRAKELLREGLDRLVEHYESPRRR